jgi:outer membrane protein OmpA-like peptidoglycan-associated protein
MRRRALLAALPAGLLGACAGSSRGDLAAQPVHVVFFQDDSVEIGAPALAVIQGAANLARRFPAAPVRVLGYAAPDITDTPIAGLSRARAERVAVELERFGIPRSRIAVQGRGRTGFDAAPVESRRVEIHIGAS